jgi:hypothetical protein
MKCGHQRGIHVSCLALGLAFDDPNDDRRGDDVFRGDDDNDDLVPSFEPFSFNFPLLPLLLLLLLTPFFFFVLLLLLLPLSEGSVLLSAVPVVAVALTFTFVVVLLLALCVIHQTSQTSANSPHRQTKIHK